MRERHSSDARNSTRRRYDVALDLSLYDASLLGDEVAFEIAVGDLKSCLARAQSAECIVEQLVSVPHLLEYIVSAVPDSTARSLNEYIIGSLPNNATDFATSLGARILDSFSLFLEFLPYPTPSEKPPNVLEKRHYVEHATHALQLLSDHPFASSGNTATKPGSKGARQKGKNPVKNASCTSEIDPKPFKALGLSVPADGDEAYAVVKSIFEELKLCMEYYLRVLRHPHLRGIIRHAYVSGNDIASSFPSPGNNSCGTVSQGSGIKQTPSAHPYVQPMKAALYFDSAHGFGEWRIWISTAADTDLRRMRKRSSELFRITLKKIKELSNGHFSSDNMKQLTRNAAIPIYEAKMTGDSRLVYQVDCMVDFETNGEQQVIKIFGIYTHNQLNRRLWETIGNQLGRQGSEYQARCAFRNLPIQLGQHAGTILPASWPELEAQEPPSTSFVLPEGQEEDLDKAHDILDLEKYVAFSQALLNSILADQDVMHVFSVSSREKEIIEYPLSCYVLGRSGTGKTTTMMFKMLGIERSWQVYGNELVKPRQMFVTQSRVLAEKVQEYFEKLHESLLAAEKSPQELKQMVSAKQVRQGPLLVDLDEEVDIPGHLPARFGDLTEDHFPLFVTYDQLCRLLEADALHSHTYVDSRGSGPDIRSGDGDPNFKSNDYMEQRRPSFVSYGKFLEAYWSHFPQQWTKGLDPALVYSEIIGIIEGSEQSLGSRYLDRETYLNLSHRAQSTFVNQRDVVYDIFLKYMEQKRRRGDYDAADRTHRILDMVQSSGVPGQRIDFLYVDEAQDNLLIDTLLLRSLSKNASTGLFWAGDTAQTISRGSAFRFDDLKAFLYRVEMDNSLQRRPQASPPTFQLTTNYRSHAGIVNCAHSVIELITTFWPYAIDQLTPESGLVEGKKPLFLSQWDESSMRYDQSLFGSSDNGHFEFGARQCILLRDDAARARLRSRVGYVGNMLTLYESKGLEFDDVLLYDFFDNSTVKVSHWRAVLKMLCHVAKVSGSKTLPVVDPLLSGVCQELKFLYVAITRARKTLWISDNSEKCEPMRDYWIANGYVEGWTASSGRPLPRLATASAPQEWAEAANTFFKSKRWPQAMEAYERAGRLRERDIAAAYNLRDQARLIPSESRGGAQLRRSAFTRAGDAFQKSGEQGVTESLSYFRVAAECYCQAQDYFRGAQAYLLAHDFNMAATTYRKAGGFDEAISIIDNHSDSMDPSIVEAIKDVARLEYLRKHKMKHALSLFGSHDDALEYMEDRGLDTVRAQFLEHLGRFSEAAQIYLDEGQTIKAIPLLLKDRHSPQSAERASLSLLEGLRYRLPFGSSPRAHAAKTDTVLSALCDMLNSKDLEMARLSDNVREELCMFREIASNKSDASELFRLSGLLQERGGDCLPAALRCLDHGVMSLPDSRLQVDDLSQLTEDLHHFVAYARLLRFFVFKPDLCDDKGMRDLVAIQEGTSQDFLVVPKDTFLYRRCVRVTGHIGIPSGDQGVSAPRSDINIHLGLALRERLLDKVRRLDLRCRNLPALQVCLQFFASGFCHRVRCPQAHKAVQDISEESYNLRIRILLQLVLIINSVYTLEDRCEFFERRAFWLRRLHEALNPSFYKMGTPYVLRPQSITEYGEGLHVVTNWIFDWLYTLRPQDDSGRLVASFPTALLRIVSLGLAFAPDALPFHLSQFESVHVLRDLDRYIRLEHPASLVSGILFINHVIMKQIPVDITALCEFLDTLCGLLIVASRINRAATLHDITMPHSWLLQVLPILHALEGKMTTNLIMYVEPMAMLLERIYTSSHTDNLLVETRDCNLTKLGFPIRNIFLARICRNLCLLGYNFRFTWLREKIYTAITSLRQPNREFHRSYRYYVEARDWNALARGVRDRSTSGSPCDEMVHLYDVKKGPSNSSFKNVRRIVYSRIDEIEALLRGGARFVPPSGPVSGATCRVAPIPQQTSTSSPEQTSSLLAAHRSSGYEEDDGAPPEDEDADAAPPVVNLDDDGLAFEEPSAAVIQLAKGKLDAAATFAKYYRARCIRKTSTAKTKTATVIHLRFVRTYRAAYHYASDGGEQEEYKRRKYRLLLLIPLPFGMAFLEHVHNHLHDKKNHLKKRLKTVAHLELEKVNNEITECNDLLKRAIRLIKALEPGAPMHEKREIDALRACMREVEQFAGCLPANVAADWELYLKIAVRGILQPNTLPKKPKPQLNMADDERIDYAGGAD